MPKATPSGTAEVRLYRRHQHLAREGDAPEAIFRMEEGWACRYKVLSSGRRQITGLFLPGDYCEPQWLLEPRAAHPIVALTSVRTRSFSLAEFSTSAPGANDNTKMMLSAMLQMLNRQSEWIATLGRKTAVERVCALLGEIFERLRLNGRVLNNRCVMPLTQADLADVVGLTPVHVNRVLKQLRAQGLVELRSRLLCLSDPRALIDIGAGTLSARAGERPRRPPFACPAQQTAGTAQPDLAIAGA